MESSQFENEAGIANKEILHEHHTKKPNDPHSNAKKNNFNTSIPDTNKSKFHQIRKITTQRKLLKSFKKIGQCLNNTNFQDLTNKNFDKVCLILINNFTDDEENPKIGSMNDGYLFGLYHYRLGFKIYYFYNYNGNEYTNYIKYFLSNTRENLTIFQSGSKNIELKMNHFENKAKCKIVLVSDSKNGNSFFNTSKISKNNNQFQPVILSFSVDEITHGIFVYYYCKIIFDDPKISIQKVVTNLKASLSRVKENFVFETTNQVDLNEPIYENCKHIVCELFDGLNHDSDDDFLGE